MKRYEGRRFESALLGWLASRSLGSIVGALIGVIAFGTIGYMIVGDVGVMDALYMAVITVSTVGYGDVVDTPAGHAFTIFYIVIGVATFSLSISSVAAFLIEGRIREVMGRRRMEQQINELQDHLILCGYGRFGQITGAEILAAGVRLVVIDSDAGQIEAAEEHEVQGIVADATEEDSLEKAGIERARALLCTLPTDAENVYTILNARELRDDIPIIALARDRRAERKLLSAGATHVVSPYSIGASYMARQILSPNVATVMNMAASHTHRIKDTGVRMQEFPIQAGSALIGLELEDSPVRRDFGVIIVAVMDAQGETHFNPGPDLVLREGDVLVSVGPDSGLQRLAEAVGGGSPK